MMKAREQLYLRAKKAWYTKDFVKFAIVRQTRGREFCFLSKFPEGYTSERKSMVRFLQCGYSSFFDKHASAFGLFRKPYLNIYHSVAMIKDMPVFSYNMRVRRESPIYINFRDNYENYMIGYDLFFDIDNLDFHKAHKDASELKKILEDYQVPCTINNSSSKGFHLKVPFRFIDWKYKDFPELVEQLKQFIYNLKVIYDIESIDSSITDCKRVSLVPYSLVRDRVILPLDDKQFKSFSFSDVDCWSVLKKVKLFNRGLLMRDYGLDEQALKDNLTTFYKEHSS